VNCFVIMPFDHDFDDVYTAIKVSVASVQACPHVQIQCSRLDEVRPAGRITNRLLEAIQVATFCVADLSGSKPNVMWEVGYAMALSKPMVIVTQHLADLPFDLKDMQSIQYDRKNLSKTLADRLRKTIIDTLQEIDSSNAVQGGIEARSEKERIVEEVQKLTLEVQALKTEAQRVKSTISEEVNEALSKVVGPGWPSPITVAQHPPKANAKLNWLSIFLGRD
jgi:hypothetical protein